MVYINRKYIDKHWMIFIFRGVLAFIFGFLTLFGNFANAQVMISVISVFLLIMGIIDSFGALYNSVKRHGWFNSILDGAVDIIAAILLLFLANGDLINSLIIISSYVFVSGIIDILHGFVSTVDPTDRFIRVLAGICGGIMGFAILNTGEFEISTFIRFFGSYMLIVGTTSLIYGAHNRAQEREDHALRKASAHMHRRIAIAKRSIRKTK